MKHVKIKVSDIGIDRRYQRDIDPRRVAVIARDLDWSRIGVPDVSLRADGTYWCIDGQNRISAIREAGHPDVALMCVVHEGMSVRDEAEMFLRLNGARVAVGAYSKFRASLTAKEQSACEIQKIVQTHGLTVAKAQAWKSICAIHAMQYAHGTNGNLSDVLDLLVGWEAHTKDKDLSVFEGVILRSLSDFLALYNGACDRKHLARRLDGYKPDHLMRAIHRAQKDNSGLQPKWVSACEVLRQAYNTKAKTKLQAAAVVASDESRA